MAKSASKRIKMVRIAIFLSDNGGFEYIVENNNTPKWGKRMQVSEDIIERWDKVFTDYENLQTELGEYFTKR